MIAPPTSILMGNAPNNLATPLAPSSPPETEVVESIPPQPKILFITPEISHVSEGMSQGAENIRAKSGGLADVSATLVNQLFAQGADVHLALPHYRDLFRRGTPNHASTQLFSAPGSRIHLAEDGAFYRRMGAYHGHSDDLRCAALAFQRELINHIIPRVQPDIIHCNDWMTGLIPAACKNLGIKTIFTIHNIHRESTTLAEIESRGIDAYEFWNLLHYDYFPGSFEAAYHHDQIDLLSSAIQNADYVTSVSPTFLEEIIHGKHGELPPSSKWDLRVKTDANYAQGILNAPDPSYDPSQDTALAQTYTPDTQRVGKRANKLALQRTLGLDENSDAPVIFWPSRLDPVQKGCQLLTEILYQLISEHDGLGLQIVVVGDGPFQSHFHDIVSLHGLQTRVAVKNFDESLSRLAFAGSDFVLMPSSFEPCGLPQMIGARYGTLPIAHNTGGLHDTVSPLADDDTSGNGFLFDHFDSNGLRWAINQALNLYRTPIAVRDRIVTRVMKEATQRFSNELMFNHYNAIYHKLAHEKSTSTPTA